MKKAASIKKFIAISSLSILLSMFTGIFAAPFIRVLRKSYDPLPFWFAGFVVTGAAWLLDAHPLAIFISSIWMTLGAYTEFELKGFGWWISGIFSSLLGSVLATVFIFSELKVRGINTYADLLGLFEPLLKRVSEMNPALKLEPEVLVQQIPSTVVIILIVSIATGLIFEKRVFSWLNLPHEKISSQLKLLEYRVPDYFIWLAMTAFLLTIVSFGGKATSVLAINIVNVSVVLYFFQGLAVFEVFLNSMKMGFFMRVLTYIIMIGQLVLILSAMGLIDYWIDFRRRIRKFTKTSEDGSFRSFK